MSFCTNCGANVGDTDKFCTKCGARRSASAAPLQQATPPQYADRVFEAQGLSAKGRSDITPFEANLMADTKKSGGGLGKNLLIWAVFWVISGIVVYVFWGQKQPEILLGIGAAAGLSLIIMLFIKWSAWEGVVEELKVERIYDENGDQDVLYAYIKTPKGKRLRKEAMGNWKVGDHLIKRRGEFNVMKVE